MLRAPIRVQTYKTLLYLLIGFPLGIAYLIGLVTGGALGVGLLITVVGLPILLLTVSVATMVAGLEAWLATSLVGVDTTVPSFLTKLELEDGLAFPGDGFVDAIRQLVTAPSTWTSVVLLLTKFVFGIVSFVAVVTSTAVVGALLSAPVLYDDPAITVGFTNPTLTGEYALGSWTVSTLPEALAVAGAGLVVGLIALNLLIALARVQAKYTAALLGVEASGT